MIPMLPTLCLAILALFGIGLSLTGFKAYIGHHNNPPLSDYLSPLV